MRQEEVLLGGRSLGVSGVGATFCAPVKRVAAGEQNQRDANIIEGSSCSYAAAAASCRIAVVKARRASSSSSYSDGL